MIPSLIDMPMPILTKRLRIEPAKPGDGPAYNKAVCDNFAHLSAWMIWAKEKPSLESSEALARSSYAKCILREELMLALWDRKTGQLVGSSGMHNIDWQVPRFEIGYWLTQRAQGKGLMSEAVNAITRYAFAELGAKRVEIRCDIENHRSAAVARRLGFQLEGVLRNHERNSHGKLRDTVVFSRIQVNDLPDQYVEWPKSSSK
ncbi:MAG: GNAT family N-acetyltransferase [Oligoflexus sp.]